MAFKIDTEFEKKLICGFKNDMRNLALFENLKIGTLMGSFNPK